MMRSTLLHLRFPFSFFLLPVFLFALSTSEPVNWVDTLVAAFILHILLYPASNGYNSFFDKDEGSIGGLKSPPAVNNSLYYTSIALDLVAIILGTIFISFTFSMMILTYGLVSKAYSHPAIRLKKISHFRLVNHFRFSGLLHLYHILHCNK